MRILGLDVGTKRIGVAVSDELLLTAQGLTTIYRHTVNRDIDEINRMIEKSGASEVVVGLPISMNGSYSAQTKEVVGFIDCLSKAVKVPVKTWDERLTTVYAERLLLEADMSRAKRKKVTDKLAAQVILQGYLDHLPKRGEGHV